MKDLITVISVISDVFTIFTAGIAIYLFLFKRKSISSAFKVLLRFSSQMTHSELTAKLERLNSLNVREPSDTDEIANIFNEIAGQLQGNKRLKEQCADILKKILYFTENPKSLTEPIKRSLVSELRENLRYINLEDFGESDGGKI